MNLLKASPFIHLAANAVVIASHASYPGVLYADHNSSVTIPIRSASLNELCITVVPPAASLPMIPHSADADFSNALKGIKICVATMLVFNVLMNSHISFCSSNSPSYVS
jgi:hypothetical protein